LQSEYIDKHRKISVFNSALAENIANNLDPKTLGFDTNSVAGAK